MSIKNKKCKLNETVFEISQKIIVEPNIPKQKMNIEIFYK